MTLLGALVVLLHLYRLNLDFLEQNRINGIVGFNVPLDTL